MAWLTPKFLRIVILFSQLFLCLFSLPQRQHVWAQDQNECPNLVEETDGFIPPQDYPAEVVIRIDQLEQFPDSDSAAVLCVEVNKPGFYRIKATARYSAGAEQINEHFFLHVTNANLNKIIHPCNPNLPSQRYIVLDATLEEADIETVVEQDAGIFFLEQGLNIISFVHYYRIHDREPGDDKFVNGKFDPSKPESIKLRRLVFERLPHCPMPNYDLQLTKIVEPSSVLPEQQFKYSLQIKNLGPSQANEFELTDILPDSIIPKIFTSTLPLDITARPPQWRFTSLDSGETINIEYTAVFPESLQVNKDSLCFTNISFL